MRCIAAVAVVFVLCLFLGADAEPNCSTENPCSSNGYCGVSKGVLSCSCRFWWEGERCERQSSNGKEVIILGALTGAMILLFYGLNIGRKIYLKRKLPKEDKPKVVIEPKVAVAAKEQLKKSCFSSSSIVAVLVVVLAVVNLLIRWGLLKSIHNQVIDRFHAGQPLFYNVSSSCEIFDIQYINVVTLPVAVLVVLICIVSNQRASLARHRCHGYIAPPIPLDFLSHIDRKFAMVVFALISNDLLDIVMNDSNSADKSIGVLVRFLLRVWKVILMGFRFYPILAAAYMKYTVPLIGATLYAWLDHAVSIAEGGMCYTSFYSTYDEYAADLSNTDSFLKYFGDGPSLLAVELCIGIPEALCLSYISVKLPWMLVVRLRKRERKNVSTEKKMSELMTREETNFLNISHPDSIEMLYVRNLFRSAEERPRSRALAARLLPKRIYEWRDDFRFTSRVLCVYSSIALLLFFVTIRIIIRVLPVLDALQDLIQLTIDTILSLFTQIQDAAAEETPEAVATTFPLPDLSKTFLAAVFMTLAIMIIQLTVLLVNIRRNLLQAYRGDDSEIPRRQRTKYVAYALGNFHFGGYFIGFLVWGFVIIAIFSTVVCVCIGAFVTYGNVRFLEIVIKALTPPLLVFLFKMYLNKLLAQFVFLQHFGDVLALDNRRCLMIFLFFNFFLDAFLGFISSIVRLIKSFIGGIFYMSRLDYSPLGRKLEGMDGGFNAYCGFIHTECTHRHPVMLVFVSHLYNEVKKREYVETHADVEPKLPKKASRYLRKWRLAAFLVRNPTIVFFRKTFLKKLASKDVRALNDLDGDSHINTHLVSAFYTRQMAAQRISGGNGADNAYLSIIRL